SALAHLDDLHPLGPLLDAAAQLLDLELQVHEAVEDELELLAGDVTARGRDPDREPASPLADVPRDVARPDFAFGGEHDHRFDEVAQLAHVAGPVGVHQDLERLRGDAVELAVVGGRELRDEAPHQERDVRPPLAQRRQIDVEDVEAVEEVVPEAAQGDLLLQGLVGRGDDAHVHLDRLRAADAEEGTVLEHTQQLHLRRRGHLPHLVEEDRAAVGQLEPAQSALGGTRERALLVAEQLALEQRIGDRRAVHRDERLAAPRGAVLETERSRASTRSCAADGSCSPPVSTRQSGIGSRRRMAWRASSTDVASAVSNPADSRAALLRTACSRSPVVITTRSAISPQCVTFSPVTSSTAWSMNPSSTARPSCTPPVEPGRLTINVLARVPATPRDSQARGNAPAAPARSASAMPGAARSRIAVVASGVTSRAVSPVPPVVRIASTSPESAQRTSFPAILSGSSGTTLRTTTS